MPGLLKQLPTPPPDKRGWPWTEETDPHLYHGREDWPKISIVTPSYNQGQFIEETIRSVLLQNYPNLEYIIIDGGSTDETLSIIKKYEAWIDFWVSEQDSGQSNAINKGLEQCTGEIFNWINSDDWFFPESFFHISEAFQLNKSAVFVYGHTLSTYTIDKPIIFDNHGANDLDSLHLGVFPYSQQSCFLKKYLIDQVGGVDERFHYKMDRDLYLKVKLIDKNFVQIKKTIGFYRFHDDSKSSNFEELFFHESSIIMSALARSSDEMNKYIPVLKKLDIYTEDKLHYDILEVYDNATWEKAFFYYMRFKPLHYFLNLKADFDKALQVCEFLRHEFPIYFNDCRQLRYQYYKLKYVPSFVIKLIRKLRK